jgi:hypothetical protein
MAQKRHTRRVLPEWSGDPKDLYDYARQPAPRAGRLPSRLERAITVTDDWPDVVPITDAELRVMESHFAEELDKVFGPRG